MRQKVILCLLSLMLFLTGCASVETQTAQGMSEMTGGMEKEAVIEYEIPESNPGILINQAGYSLQSDKIAIFRGENLPETFRVYNAESKNQVYEGTVEEKGIDKLTGEKVAYGSFSDFKVPGDYYIQADILGYSYTFSIGRQVYQELLETNLQQLCEDLRSKTQLTSDEVRQNCEAVINMLLANEMHGTAFHDDMGIMESGNEVSDLVDVLLIQVTLLSNQKDMVLASEDWNMVAYYAAALAKFSYTYKEYDSAVATSCLQLADMVWKYMDQNGQKVNADMRFMAAAELYRASGAQKYHFYIKEYAAALEKKIESREAFYGAVTYISTKQAVDVELCTGLMKEIMAEAEAISTGSKEFYYQVDLDETKDGNEEILWNMVVLTVADYIISNHEYATVITNHLHYLLGRNPLAVSYIDEVGELSYADKEGQESILDGGFKESALIFMLSEVVSQS